MHRHINRVATLGRKILYEKPVIVIKLTVIINCYNGQTKKWNLWVILKQ